MTALHERLGVSVEQIEDLDLLNAPVLAAPDALFDQAFERCRTNPDEAQTLLAAALLSTAARTPEGRLSAALSLLARLVAQANPMKSLGPDGAEIRHHIMPNGWRHTAQSWPRLRYAWREGLRDLLDVVPGDPIAEALDEVTRLNPAEPEPVSVAIQEQFPPAPIAFGITIVGLGLSFFGIMTAMARERRMEERMAKMERIARRRG